VNLPLPKENKRPVKELRDQLRRDQIVAAAQACVVRHGFHAASVGQIAAEAQMSVGQIYRYFPSKEAIVHAIVEGIVAKRLQWMVSREERVDFAAVFANRSVIHKSDDEHSDRILLLEITAEATRNAAVAEIVREADRRILTQAVAIVRADYPELSEQEVIARVELIAVLSEGTAFRRVMQQRADPVVLENLYREVIGAAFPNQRSLQR
jgi:AcrR family transcriptional regulator